jgi:hypothetical protein
MTEKRFKLSKPNGAYLIDNDKPYAHWINDDDKIVDLLNSLADENEQLKSKVDYLEMKIQRERTSAMKQHEKWEEEIQKENKELKQTIDELRTIDKEKNIETEHINNIYNEFGFKGIIKYAKDKLQNYGAVREVDTGLWLLATGGWSDNEFWLDCLLDWNFMYGKGHYRATTSGGGYYYSEKPYADIWIMLNNTKGDLE